MKPTTLRTAGTLCMAVGVLGLVAFVAMIALVGTGTSEPPQTFMIVVVPVQSVVNVVIGWTLRRQAAQASG